MASLTLEKNGNGGIDVIVSVAPEELGDGSTAAILESAQQALRSQLRKENLAASADVQIAELQDAKTQVVAAPK